MAKIKGRFAPLTEELGHDERFIVQCSDFEKLMYLLIVYTTHMTHHQAPIDPRFYQVRYGIKARSGQIRHTIQRLLCLYPRLAVSDGKLSLLNSTTYESQDAIEVEEESEKNKSKKETASVFEEAVEKKEPLFNQLEAFRTLWAQYPGRGRVNESESLRIFCEAVVSRENFSRILKSLANYTAHLRANVWKQPKGFPKWFLEWPDWEKRSVEIDYADSPKSSLEKLKELREKRVSEHT